LPAVAVSTETNKSINMSKPWKFFRFIPSERQHYVPVSQFLA